VNAREKAEDEVMNHGRESIEHSYSDMGNHFKILHQREEMRLGRNAISVLQTYRVCHLLYNLRVCAYGNVISSPNTFDCRAPSVVEYLNM
jgi:hypothetical protein